MMAKPLIILAGKFERRPKYDLYHLLHGLENERRQFRNNYRIWWWTCNEADMKSRHHVLNAFRTTLACRWSSESLLAGTQDQISKSVLTKPVQSIHAIEPYQQRVWAASLSTSPSPSTVRAVSK